MRIALRLTPSAARAIRFAAAIAAALFAPAAAQDADAAAEVLRKGDLAEAKILLGQAVKLNPADCNAALSYASTLPPKDALKLADSISRAQSAPGWARARGAKISGDYLFLTGDYKKSAEAYLQASKSDSASTTYKHLYALSIAMDGQTELARAVWNEISLDKNNELSGEAARILALLPLPQPPPPSAPITPAGPPSAPASPPVAPPASPPVASVNQQNNIVKTDSVKTQPKPAATVTPPAPASPPVSPPVASVNQQNNIVKTDTVKTQPKPAATVTPPAPANPPVSPPVAPVNQQNNAVKTDSVKTPATSATPVNPPAAPKPTGPVFTIQVGAFASKENVDNLIKRLAGKYDDVTVSTTGSGDQTLYRVRVGTFYKKEDATAYADKLIIEAGLSARVTEK